MRLSWPITATFVALAMTGLLATSPAAAARFEVKDERGEPVARVAVYATNVRGAGPESAAKPPPAVMDQHDNEFVPHMLIVETGTEVRFPNNDVVSHHVYSFSPAKTFELGLYKGNVHPPLVFDEPGVVTLGCNIHDSMLAYVLVVPTPHFALTDERGVAELDLPAGEYVVEAWTPRARPNGLPPSQHVVVSANGSPVTAFHITGRLAPPHDHGASSLSWERY